MTYDMEDVLKSRIARYREVVGSTVPLRNYCTPFLAEDLTHIGGQELDHGEFVDVDTMHFPDVLAAAERGEITDVKTVAALWYLSRRFPG